MNKKQKSSLREVWGVIVRLFSRHRRAVRDLAFIGIVLALAQGIVPYVAGRFFDSIITPSHVMLYGNLVPLWAVFLVIMAALQIFDNVLNWRMRLETQALGMKIFGEYNTEAFTKILRLPVAFHKDEKMGKVGNKISRASNYLHNTFVPLFTETASEVLSIIVAFAVLVFLNPVLTGVLALGLSVYVYLMLQKVPEGVVIQKKVHKVWSDVWGDVWESLMNGLTVKQAATEGYEERQIQNGFQKRGFSVSLKNIEYWSSLSFIQGMVVVSVRLVIFIVSVRLIFAGTMSIGELIAFNAYASFVFGPFARLAHRWQNIQNGAVEIHETEKMLQKKLEVYTPKDAVPLGMVKGSVVFENVHFRYTKGQDVLKDVSFEVQPNQVVAFVGESGVGKSTIVDLLTGFYFPKKGKVLIDGVPIQKIDLQELRSQISVVPQDVVLFNDTLEKNVMYGSENGTHEEVLRVAELAHVREFVEKLPKGWKTKVGERGVKLSGGQKQRIGMARALMQKPQILILDEPTSALDPQTERDIQDSLKILMQNTTTFIIAHRLSTVRSADLILVFKDGSICERGTHAELITKNGEYKRLYDLQFDTTEI